MLFAHLADVHIGAWRDPRMKELPIQAFERAVDLITERKADFTIIAGDFFNTSVPPLDQVKRAVTQLQRLKAAGIPVYAIAGSHDYSPSGKTMLDVLEEAGLLVNVMKGEVVDGKITLRWTTDERTGVKLTGIIGRAGSLDRTYYEDLNRDALEQEPGEKIFLFHTSLTELKPKALEKIESAPASMMPKGCRYYAGGHVHIVNATRLPGYEAIVYPGPLFPANFSELEELGRGSFCFVKDWEVERVPVELKTCASFHVDADKKTPEMVNALLGELREEDVAGKIVLLRITGELCEGRIADVQTKTLVQQWYERGAYFVMRNTAQLSSKELAEVQVRGATTEEVELKVIREHAGQTPLGLNTEEEVALTKELLNTLGEEKPEGEKQYEYEERVQREARTLLERRAQ
ncbi:DNA repair exonuclease [Candidatus Woesearchaeota archaeon]|nr:MAG: DNA repair exonuclease [Candidatus Woesearchaeota archaeon]